MKKTLFLSACLLLGSCCLFAQSPAGVLSGTVIDSSGQKPMAGVSVFFNSTQKGTVTRDDGTFMLSGISRGKYELVVSAISYETMVIPIDGGNLPPALKIVLHPRPTELESVTIEPDLKDGWERFGKYFLNNFLGTMENAKSCRIRNAGVLRFHFRKRANLLTVTATEPLIIENNALGYTLQYRLETFRGDFNNGYIVYLGYPFFQEMAGSRGQRRRWEAHRRLAYMGSIMHFMRSLYNGHLREEGFLTGQTRKVPNWEKQRVRAIYNPEMPTNEVFAPDTLHHFLEVLKQPDSLTLNVRLTADSLLSVSPDHRRTLFFPGICRVIYGNGQEGIAFRESGIQIVDPVMIQVEENGSYYPPQELVVFGYWAASEKISNELPMDYLLP